MRHDSSQFRLVFRRLNGPHIDVDGPARQGEGIDLFLIHYVEVVRPLLPRRMGHQFGAELLDILHDRIGIRQHRQLLIGIGGGLLADLYFLVGGKQIESTAGLYSG